MKDAIQLQYETAVQQIYNLMQTEIVVPTNDVDEMELVCELVELYEKIYYPINDTEG